MILAVALIELASKAEGRRVEQNLVEGTRAKQRQVLVRFASLPCETSTMDTFDAESPGALRKLMLKRIRMSVGSMKVGLQECWDRYVS